MATEIQITPEDLLVLRRKINEPLFAKTDNSETQIFMSYKGMILKATISIDDPIWESIKSFVNKPVIAYDKRLTSHNFGDSTTWPLVEGFPNSTYKFAPDFGMILSIAFIQVRFPINANLTDTCRLFFRVYLNLGNGPVLVINLEYPNIFELIKKSNSPIQIQPTVIETVSSLQIAEIEFKYADPNTLEGSPIILRSSLGEYMEMGTTDNLPVLDNVGNPLLNPTWAIVNGKQSRDF